MTADPITEPMDPIDLLIAFEEAADVPIRPECVEGTVVVPRQPDFNHGDSALQMCRQLCSAGFRYAGSGMGFRVGIKGEQTRSLVIPDFYVLHCRPSEVDEAYRRVHKGWYSIELLALVGEVTSTNHETDSGPKYRSYAAAGIPVYVLIHRQDRMAYAFSDPAPEEDPVNSHYTTKTAVDLGRPLPLPVPYPALDTTILLDE
ncbi:Uma2 family endonuclease [Streptomyces gobiensis]|uniref:Uma2 family endonuclease n=1 Tax=Streptomyces gobiensis TaxID=2875706 RepID=UPI001E51D591|nr:Uma2 family endonuclease [Streptomyces gobiensis]UGY92827.1 Uma2 family endonuclease [Streptomyces gobiensis]